jgi:hypothetical protein
MKIAGTVEDFFRSINTWKRFPAVGAVGSPGPVGLDSRASGVLAPKASASVLGQKWDGKKLRKLIRQETAKAINSRQSPGLNFDLFG